MFQQSGNKQITDGRTSDKYDVNATTVKLISEGRSWIASVSPNLFTSDENKYQHLCNLLQNNYVPLQLDHVQTTRYSDRQINDDCRLQWCQFIVFPSSNFLI